MILSKELSQVKLHRISVIIESPRTSMATFQFVSFTCQLVALPVALSVNATACVTCVPVPAASLQRERRLYKLGLGFMARAREW